MGRSTPNFGHIAAPHQATRCANDGHRKLLHLRLRGSEFNDGDQSNQNENDQHSGLGDREGWFGLHRSQRIESRNLHEALHDQNEDVKIKRHNSGNYVDPAPCAYQVLFVQSKQRDGEDHIGPVAGLVGIDDGVVSGVTNLESPGVRAPIRRPRHEEGYHDA